MRVFDPKEYLCHIEEHGYHIVFFFGRHPLRAESSQSLLLRASCHEGNGMQKADCYLPKYKQLLL
ncbi:MAG: hypothetical protein EPN37_11420 [Chitinophagaceae bacterium]|jgi:hypothetical protein|nr:MAG: hypothetical protein EPN37_11420 [Chitinophagaceae bacterium]